MKKQVARVARVMCILKNSILRPLRRDLLKTPNESRKSRDAPVCGKLNTTAIVYVRPLIYQLYIAAQNTGLDSL